MTTSTKTRLAGSVRLLVPVCAGVAAGIVTSLLTARPIPTAAASDSHVTVIERPAAPAPARAQGTPPRDLARLSQRVDAMEEKLGERPAETPRPAAEDIEALKKKHEDDIADKLQKQAVEPRDPVWARASQDTVRAEIGGLAASTGQEVGVKSVDCQTTGCIATLEFTSLTAARQGYTRYVTDGLGMRCAQTAQLDEEGDPSAPAEVKILFYDCLKDAP